MENINQMKFSCNGEYLFIGLSKNCVFSYKCPAYMTRSMQSVYESKHFLSFVVVVLFWDEWVFHQLLWSTKSNNKVAKLIGKIKSIFLQKTTKWVPFILFKQNILVKSFQFDIMPGYTCVYIVLNCTNFYLILSFEEISWFLGTKYTTHKCFSSNNFILRKYIYVLRMI